MGVHDVPSNIILIVLLMSTSWTPADLLSQDYL
jgi:hypothetical protein